MRLYFSESHGSSLASIAVANCLRFSPAIILLSARHCRRSVSFQFQTSISKHIEVIFVIGQYLVDSSVATCCLQFGTFLCVFCKLLKRKFPGESYPSIRPYTLWSGGLWDFCGSSIHPLVPFRKSCTKDLESCGPSQLLRKSDNLCFDP